MAAIATQTEASKIGIPQSNRFPARIGTNLVKYTKELSWDNSSDSQYLLINMEDDFVHGAFVDLEMYQTLAAGTQNIDDVDILACPAVKNPSDSSFESSQVGFYMIQEAADFSSESGHSYSLSNFHSGLTSGYVEKHLQGRGFFLKFTPAAAMTGTFTINILVR
jgi:hypothetical protein